MKASMWSSKRISSQGPVLQLRPPKHAASPAATKACPLVGIARWHAPTYLVPASTTFASQQSKYRRPIANSWQGTKQQVGLSAGAEDAVRKLVHCRMQRLPLRLPYGFARPSRNTRSCRASCIWPAPTSLLAPTAVTLGKR